MLRKLVDSDKGENVTLADLIKKKVSDLTDEYLHMPDKEVGNKREAHQ